MVQIFEYKITEIDWYPDNGLDSSNVIEFVEKQMNDIAVKGYQLVQIIESRGLLIWCKVSGELEDKAGEFIDSVINTLEDMIIKSVPPKDDKVHES